MRLELCSVDDVQPGEMLATSTGGVELVVVRKHDGSFRVLRDRCSHHGARLSRGLLQRRIEGDEVGERHLVENLIVRCPWHGYEFDVDSGRCPADPLRVRVRSYDVTLEEGKVVIHR